MEKHPTEKNIPQNPPPSKEDDPHDFMLPMSKPGDKDYDS